MSSALSFFGKHKILSGLLVLIILAVAFIFSLRIGPHHNYSLDLALPAPEATVQPQDLQIGVAMRDITPDFEEYDSWIDVNENSKFDEGVDTYVDRNGNGRFDGIWIAGFNTNRPATGIHDPQWVRVIALRNNDVTLVMCTYDAIGIFHNDFVTIRKMIDPSLGVDHIAFSSSHSHEVVDTMKIWSFWKRIRVKGKDLDVPLLGYNEQYMAQVQEKTKAAIEEAVANLQPADMTYAKARVPDKGYVNDTRKPHVVDPYIYAMHFTKKGSDTTIATLVNWGNHPETLGSDNTLLTSDFCHYLREGVEKGVPDPMGAKGLGGMCLYFQGMVGGLMTQIRVDVPHRDGSKIFTEDTFERAEHLGYNSALLVLNALRGPEAVKQESPMVAVAAKTFMAPMQGLFKYAMMLGLIHEGYYWGSKSKSEVNALRVGDVVMLTVPGEIYPEIVEGGIQALPGRDFEVPPIEVPPLREVMEEKGKMAFVIGLANDEVGYIIPKSQWDKKPPYVYDNDDQYGEENSGGPDVAGAIHSNALEVLSRINATFK